MSLPRNIFRVPVGLGVDDVLARAATGVEEEAERVLCAIPFAFISRKSFPFIIDPMDMIRYSL